MIAVDGREAKAGKRAGNYGDCEGILGLIFPTFKKRNFLSINGILHYLKCSQINMCSLRIIYI
jgi:hypothetical protein